MTCHARLFNHLLFEFDRELSHELLHKDAETIENTTCQQRELEAELTASIVLPQFGIQHGIPFCIV